MASRSSRYDDDDDDYPRRRRRRNDDDDDTGRRRRPPPPSNTGLWIGLTVGGAILLMLALAFVLFRSRSAPPGFEPPPPIEFGGLAQPLENAPPLPGTLPVDGMSILSFAVSGDGNGHGIAVNSGPNRGGRKLTVFPLMGRGNGTDGGLETPITSLGLVVASHDGKRLAVVESKPGLGDAIHIYSVADGVEVGAFTPYPRAGGRAGDLSWISFIPDGRLLTINSPGGYDVWTVPGFQRQHGRTGTLRGFNEMRMNLFTHAPTNFALTADGGKVAIFNGSGFTLYDTATGNKLVDLDPAMAPGSICNHWAAALNADGSRFAYMFSNNSEQANRGPRLMTWDATTGRRVADVGVGNNTPAGMGWWGDKHLLGWQGGMASADVYDAVTGQVVGTVTGNGIVKMAPLTPGNQLHCLATEFNRGTILVTVDAPNNPRRGMRVGVNGLEN